MAKEKKANKSGYYTDRMKEATEGFPKEFLKKIKEDMNGNSFIRKRKPNKNNSSEEENNHENKAHNR
jgi:C4-type Zn-finger protein